MAKKPVPKKTLKIRASQIAHGIVNRLAWKFAPEHTHDKATRHWLWKLNDFVARPHVDWYVYKQTGKTNLS